MTMKTRLILDALCWAIATTILVVVGWYIAAIVVGMCGSVYILKCAQMYDAIMRSQNDFT